MAAPPKDIDDYLARITPAQRDALQKLRRQILSLVPGAEECISYSMPAFREPGGRVVAGFLATNKGCSYFPFSGTTLDSMAADLEGYSRTKSGLHFDPARGLPQVLLRKLLATRRAELASYPAAHEVGTRDTKKTSAAGAQRRGTPAKTSTAQRAARKNAPTKKASRAAAKKRS